ncbi:hypothetical protein FHT98_3428 [Bosea sp. AK1]|uniref:glycosyltransferase family A protein n=1 Tax=Bosea sp. AK1 TaxID=2587160 RepID=UPI001151FD17|nr:glycosyltransferase family A protein [Bosea sp. AK1]TQI75644.1 hypothetical protein FHT98_3428 [Bosea sp. AK1]
MPSPSSTAEPITISLTTIRARLPTLHLTLESLAQQSYPSLTIRLYVSRDAFLLDEGIDALPDACMRVIEEHAPRIEVHFVRNIGSYRKLVPLLEERLGQSSLVVTADDDTLYPPSWVSDLYFHYRLQNCIVCYRGHQMAYDDSGWINYRSWMRRPPGASRSVLNLPTGKDGVLYNTIFFHPDVLDMQRGVALARTVDDLWFKWHSAILDVPVFMIHADYRVNSLPETTKDHSLYKNFNEQGGNDRAIAAIEADFRTRYGDTLLGEIRRREI